MAQQLEDSVNALKVQYRQLYDQIISERIKKGTKKNTLSNLATTMIEGIDLIACAFPLDPIKLLSDDTNQEIYSRPSEENIVTTVTQPSIPKYLESALEPYIKQGIEAKKRETSLSFDSTNNYTNLVLQRTIYIQAQNEFVNHLILKTT